MRAVVRSGTCVCALCAPSRAGLRVHMDTVASPWRPWSLEPPVPFWPDTSLRTMEAESGRESRMGEEAGPA